MSIENYPNMCIYEEMLIYEKEDIPIDIIKNAYYERDLFYNYDNNREFLYENYKKLLPIVDLEKDKKLKETVFHCNNKLFYQLLSKKDFDIIGW